METEEIKANKDVIEEEDGNSQKREIKKIKSGKHPKSQSHSQKQRPKSGVEVVSSGPVNREKRQRAPKKTTHEDSFIEDDMDVEDDGDGDEDYMDEEF